jgi:hypothetical protein
MQRVFGASVQAGKQGEGAQECDVPDIFVTERKQV